MAKARTNRRNAEPAGLWHQPVLMGLLADALLVLGIAGLSWAALTVLQRLPLFPLREVVLAATPQRVSAEQIAHVARTSIVGNFFTIDLEAAQTAFEKLPWVRKVTVRRQWPGTLLLTLDEHEAVAHWQHHDGDTALVNRQGEVFTVEATDALPPLPRLSGPEGSAAEILARHAEFNGLLSRIGRKADAVVLSPRRAWQLKLDDGVAIELGRDREQLPLTERLERFVAHYPDARARLGGFRVADMRYPNGFALAGFERPPVLTRPSQPRQTS